VLLSTYRNVFPLTESQGHSLSYGFHHRRGVLWPQETSSYVHACGRNVASSLTPVMLAAGIVQLRLLRMLTLAIDDVEDKPLRSYCSLPDGLSGLSSLTYLSLMRYCDHVETQALLFLTSLEHL
jgi:hypothetical protein